MFKCFNDLIPGRLLGARFPAPKMVRNFMSHGILR